ncbi:hypothetical protein ACFPAF_02190 [Hymenobacter endophyticus]|uniref:Photosynthesis system II assembly factor Ycf48/Hcf136-like domain-containing protein n=1 Tax=Hymenobacter endophyticus TaxID=3076335 RepID=A0ABU3TCV9_9BACT|nr:hypothetical protein [Hymenobacter endophyticus]MDU0369190.1 hypothetical protein [Hymenobacter endophyticus]
MRIFTLGAIRQIQDFQFLTDSSGYVLADGGQLYRFRGNHTELVPTPANFTVTQFYFLSATHGAVAGNFRPAAVLLQQGSAGVVSLLPVLLGLMVLLRRSGAAWRRGAGLASVLLTGSLVFGCSRAWQQYRTPDPASEGVTHLSRNKLKASSGGHTYFANKGQQAFIALTQTAGASWETQQIPTNFYVTALTAIGRNFLVGTYANPYEGTRSPMHADGDVWIYGQDSAFSPELAQNSPAHPYGLSVHRAVRGFSFSAAGEQLFIFGSDRMPTLPPDEISATAGNIYALPLALHPPYRLLDVPDTVEVTSLAQADTGELWATLDNRKPRLSKGILRYVPLPNRQLLRFAQGRWQPYAVPEARSFRQVAFVAGTGNGYLLTEDGQVVATSNSGTTWEPLPLLRNIRQLKVWQQAVTLQQGANRLLLVPDHTRR